jgi:type II secretory pathway pseudopilin PulG
MRNLRLVLVVIVLFGALAGGALWSWQEDVRRCRAEAARVTFDIQTQHAMYRSSAHAKTVQACLSRGLLPEAPFTPS